MVKIKDFIEKVYKKITETLVYKKLDEFYRKHPIMFDIVILTGEITILYIIVKFILLLV